jgi:hypothetical protein
MFCIIFLTQSVSEANSRSAILEVLRLSWGRESSLSCSKEPVWSIVIASPPPKNLIETHSSIPKLQNNFSSRICRFSTTRTFFRFQFHRSCPSKKLKSKIIPHECFKNKVTLYLKTVTYIIKFLRDNSLLPPKKSLNVITRNYSTDRAFHGKRIR